jgi:hypothetical protein
MATHSPFPACARLAGEIIQAREIVASRTKEPPALDAVIRLFTPDGDPDMTAPIRPSTRGLFFRCQELGATLPERDAEGRRACHTGMDRGRGDGREGAARRQTGRVRRVIDEPDQWWELVW